MQLDVAELRAFYATPLGGVARRIVAQRIRLHWRRAEGMVVMGVGYASPYLGSFRGEAARLGALMPAAQGAVLWPGTGPVRTVMVEEERLPLPDNTVDRLLMIHCLEATGGHARALLREAWRVLAPGGRLLIVVPNRRGVWSRRDGTPFGHGQPYSRGQLERLLQDALFTPIAWDTALHVPPVERRMVIRWSTTVEKLGSRLWPLFAGVLMVEARKEMAAPIVQGIKLRKLRPMAVVEAHAAKRSVVDAVPTGRDQPRMETLNLTRPPLLHSPSRETD